MTTPQSVNELPAEILGMIFFEFLEEEVDQKWRSQHPGCLIPVCRLWKELVEGNSRLWSRIDVVLGTTNTTMDVQSISNRIRKAKRSPLALYIYHRDWRLYPTAAVTRDVLALYDLIKDHRWRAISVFNGGHLASFEIIFRHMIDHPQMCRLFSFHMEQPVSNDTTRVMVKEALRRNLSITQLTVPTSFLEPSFPLYQVVSYLEVVGLCDQTEILSHLRGASSLRSLRVECLVGITVDQDDSPPPCALPKLENLDLRSCHIFPKLLIQKLDLPAIWNLKLRRVYWSVKRTDQELKSLVSDVSWLTRIKSLNLEEVQVSEATLLWTLQRLPLLRNLTLASWKRISCKTTKKLSEQPTARRRWLCPLLEEIEFGACPKLSESDVTALVEARVSDISSLAPASKISPSLLRKVIWGGRDTASV
ncbi:hypothetical protein FRB93_013401 [Tulasnella sp. JGI-2019a]|nr:hypothetical protein FRB93_013401 [Tulasnella sp. JGI-2019a]